MSDAVSKKALLEWAKRHLTHYAEESLRIEVNSGRLFIPSPAEERYREALESTLSALEMLSAGLPVANLDEVIANAITTLSTSPSGEQADGNKKRFPGINAPEKEDKTCVICRRREGVNLSTAHRWYCQPCTDALPSVDKEETDA